MNANKSCIATFTLQQFTLTLTKAGTGTGNVTGAGTYNDQATATVTATPNAGSTFAGWSGPNGAECTTGSVLMNADKSCTATFRLKRTLTVSTAGNGTVTSSPAGINCGGDCVEDYPEGTVVTLTPTPDSGWQFDNWSGAGDCTNGSVTMTVALSCTANFSLIPIVVPNVVNLSQSAAQSALTTAGLTVGTVTTTPNETVAAGNVISQSPAAGVSVAPGSAIALVVSSGPPAFLMGVQNDPLTGPLVNSLYRIRTNGVVTKIADLNHRTHGLAFVGSTLYSIEELTLSQSGTPPKLYTLNPDTGATLASIPLSLSTGESVEGARGVATEPGTNQLWALLIVTSEVNSFRRLVTINPTTGLATQKAKLPGNFMDMAFDASGTLYVITDNRAVPGGSPPVAPARIYTVNKTNGATTEFLDVSAGAVAGQPNFRESETIGAGFSSDLLYHLSGQHKVTTCCTKNILFESIHLTTKVRTPIAISGPDFFVTTALTLVPTNSSHALGDLDANGKADIVFRNTSDGNTAIWLMNGTTIASFGFPGGVPLVWQIAGVGDVNGDGKADVIWRNTSGTVAVWLMNGVTVTSVGFPGSASTDFQIAGVGDVSGDGKADIVFRNTSDGNTAIWLMNGTTIASFGFPGGVPLVWQIAGVGDVNGDGKADVIWRNTSGTVAVWLMNGVTVTSVGFPGSASTDFQIAGVGDVSGDGKADIVFRNTSDGTTAIWLMNGTAIASFGFPGGVSLTWQIARVGDVNGDGKADVIWRNISGTVAVWLMNSLTISSVGFPGSASTEWQIQ